MCHRIFVKRQLNYNLAVMSLATDMLWEYAEVTRPIVITTQRNRFFSNAVKYAAMMVGFSPLVVLFIM